VQKYMAAIEEIINIPNLLNIFDEVTKAGHLRDILNEIIKWSKVEFNYMATDNGQPGTITDDDEDEE